MPHDLILCMHAKLPSRLGPAIVFHRWLPMADKKLSAEIDNFAFSFSWDLNCLAHVKTIEEKDIPKQGNLRTNRVHVEVSIPNVGDELAEYIWRRGEEQNFQGSPENESEFCELAVRIYNATIKGLNRLVSTIRETRGQYWALPISFEEGNENSFFVGSKASVKSKCFSATSWDPPLDYKFDVTIRSHERYIHEHHWSEIQSAINGTSHNSLVREFITYSEQLFAEGHISAALVQSVMALELAVNAFVKKPSKDFFSSLNVRGDLDVLSLQGLSDKVGFRNTLALLFPLIFTEEQFPIDLLAKCKAAVQTRGNVIHNGQRRLESGKVQEYLDQIREAINRLETMSSIKKNRK